MENGILALRGKYPFRSGTLLCKCQPVRRRGEWSGGNPPSQIRWLIVDAEAYHTFGLLGGARSAGIAAEADELRN